MTREASRVLPLVLYTALVVLFVLHNDFWLWNDGRLVLGLPVGLTYHVGFCLVISLILLFANPFIGAAGG